MQLKSFYVKIHLSQFHYAVPGFCPKLLAVRPVPHARYVSASLFRLHIYYLFTLFGLSLPYRIWFAKHCDEVRVSVVKETSDSTTPNENIDEPSPAGEAKPSWLKSKIWGQSSAISSADVERRKAQELFRKSMQSFSLYEAEPSSMDLNLGNKETVETTTTDYGNTVDDNHLPTPQDEDTTLVTDVISESTNATALSSDVTVNSTESIAKVFPPDQPSSNS